MIQEEVFRKRFNLITDFLSFLHYQWSLIVCLHNFITNWSYLWHPAIYIHEWQTWHSFAYVVLSIYCRLTYIQSHTESIMFIFEDYFQSVWSINHGIDVSEVRFKSNLKLFSAENILQHRGQRTDKKSRSFHRMLCKIKIRVQAKDL